MLFAVINNNLVTCLIDIIDPSLDPSEYLSHANKNQNVVDVSEVIPQPQIGWKVEGNQLIGQSDSIPKIYSFVKNANSSIPPLCIDYVTSLNIKLHRKSIIVKGECKFEEFYEKYDGVTYSNLVVKESHSFIRNPLGFAIKRDTIITWYNNDGQPNPITKNLPKYYSSVEQIEEGKTRRGNLVNALQMPTIGLISIALIGSTNATMAVILEGRKFLAEYKLEFDMFISESNKTILECFNNPAHPKYIVAANYSWIDSMTPYGVTIRNYLYNEMNI